MPSVGIWEDQTLRDDIQIIDYNVVLYTRHEDGAATVVGTVEELIPVLSRPIQVTNAPEEDSGVEFVSGHDQLVLQLRPPTASLTDVSGELPIRPTFTRGLESVINLLHSKSVEILACGWNINGSLPTSDRVRLANQIFDVQAVDVLLGGDIEPGWQVPSLEFGFWFGPEPTHYLTLALSHQPQGEEFPPLEFTINSSTEQGEVDLKWIVDQGKDVAQRAESILDRIGQ